MTAEAAVVLFFFLFTFFSLVQLAVLGLQRSQLRLAAYAAARAVAISDPRDLRAFALAELERRLGAGAPIELSLTDSGALVHLRVTRHQPLFFAPAGEWNHGQGRHGPGVAHLDRGSRQSRAALRITTEAAHARPWVNEGPRP